MQNTLYINFKIYILFSHMVKILFNISTTFEGYSLNN